MQLQKNTRNSWRLRRPLVFIAVCLIVVLGEIFITGNLPYYTKWMICGHSPYKEVYIPVMGDAPIRYYQSTQPAPSFRGGMKTYFCTTEQAEAAGLRSREAILADPEINGPTLQLILDAR